MTDFGLETIFFLTFSIFIDFWPTQLHNSNYGIKMDVHSEKSNMTVFMRIKTTGNLKVCSY